MSFNHNKLRGRIKEIFGTQSEFSKLLGMSNATLTSKLKNTSEFTQDEIARAIYLLKLKNSDIPDYFFTEEFRKNKHSKSA